MAVAINESRCDLNTPSRGRFAEILPSIDLSFGLMENHKERRANYAASTSGCVSRGSRKTAGNEPDRDEVGIIRESA
jgi:hypothetical protein